MITPDRYQAELVSAIHASHLEGLIDDDDVRALLELAEEGSEGA